MITYLTGKSASGKDSIVKALVERVKELELYIPYTTRSKRSHEIDGKDYHFITEGELEKLEKAGQVVEKRVYNTVHGPWIYATVDDFDSHSDVIMIDTLESFRAVREKLGADRVKGIYIECPDGVRLQRALDREKSEETPKNKEMCRRILADEEDYSPGKIKEVAVDRVFRNDDLKHCVEQIEDYIKSLL